MELTGHWSSYMYDHVSTRSSTFLLALYEAPYQEHECENAADSDDGHYYQKRDDVQADVLDPVQSLSCSHCRP